MKKFEQVNFIINHIFVLKTELWEIEIEIELIWIACYIKWKILDVKMFERAKIMTSDKTKVRSE